METSSGLFTFKPLPTIDVHEEDFNADVAYS